MRGNIQLWPRQLRGCNLHALRDEWHENLRSDVHLLRHKCRDEELGHGLQQRDGQVP